MTARRSGWLSSGLFLTTFATLVLEILDSRLLSVLTWYHLSFLAVSLAMLGMASGAVVVFLGGARFERERAVRALSRATLAFAISIPLSHVANLYIPVPALEHVSLTEISLLALATVVLGVPFFFSGIVVTIALTRTGLAIGRLYAADLIGASAGCLLVVPLLSSMDISSVAMLAGAAAGAAAGCFERYADQRGWASTTVALTLVAVAGVNVAASGPIGVVFAKGKPLQRSYVELAEWNSHSYVTVQRRFTGPPFLWGGAKPPERLRVRQAWLIIDGEAGTPITQWNGDPASIEWVRRDVTTLAYHLRRQGDAGVIGVGGGRDILSAIWAGSRSVTGIEINGIVHSALTDRYRTFAGVADWPGVRLVHDEARSYLSRAPQRFDVLQMSLIDTWAATGAGAFTLTENGLYTIEAWRLFLDRLTPTGIFSVSRWFNPADVSETNRLLALGVAALIDRGVDRPRDHAVLVASGTVATLLVSNAPFTTADRTIVEEAMRGYGFRPLATPWRDGPDARLNQIASSRSRSELDAAIAHPHYDYAPPTDTRPFFFNMLKPASFEHAYRAEGVGVLGGNLRATTTLVTLFLISAVLVGLIIVWPLIRAGAPSIGRSRFVAALTYFALIGAGFMLIQIPLLQRFSVFLGHPTWTFAVILFSMILFAGLGAALSDRFFVPEGRLFRFIPFAIAAVLAIVLVVLEDAISSNVHRSIAARSAIVVGVMAPLSVLLGFCFPIGMRLVGRLSDRLTAWMWGVNGACAVLASIAAVAISMWIGIHANLFLAAGCYLALAIPMKMLSGPD